MEFEFGPRKSVSNKRKHGIDFIEAQVLWDDPDRLEIPAKTQREKRLVLIGKIADMWVSLKTKHFGEGKEARRGKPECMGEYMRM